MIDNKYHIWYKSIIQKAISENRKKGCGVYYEKHHIVPKSLGGSNKKSNLVLLTAKEHIICHHLLVKFTVGLDKSKMLYAYWSLVNAWGNFRITPKISAKQYAILKEIISIQISENNTGRVGNPCKPENKEAARKRMVENNPQKGKDPHNKGKKRPGVGGRKKGTSWSETERLNQMRVRSAPNYYDYFKDPVRCEKIRNSQRGRPGTSTGTIWCNDGVKEYQMVEVPDGFIKGRLKLTNSNKLGLRWFNNGIENRQFKEGEEKEGFKHGRLSKK